MEQVLWRIRGRVQGVALRGRIAILARELGLGGWVRNEPDGSVLLRLRGAKETIAKMRETLLSMHERFGPNVGGVEELAGEQRAGEEAGEGFAVLD